MNVKRIVPLVIFIIFSLIGSNVVHASSDQPTKKDCKYVYDCVNDSGSKSESPGSDASKQQQEQISDGSGSTTVMTTIKVIFALIFVVALMIVVLKLLHKRTRSVQQGKGIHTLGGAMVGNQRSVQLVKVGNRILVVGVGENVSLIKEIDDEEELRALLSQHEDTDRSIQMKSGLLEWVKGRFATPDSENSFQATLKQRLDDVKQGRNAIYETLKKEQNNDRSSRNQ